MTNPFRKHVYEYIQSLKGKYIIVHEDVWGTTPPIYIKSAGWKRIHIQVLGVGSYYYTFEAFVKMLLKYHEVVDDVKVSKYCLTDDERSLLDV
jgi:hypothetical protein